MCIHVGLKKRLQKLPVRGTTTTNTTTLLKPRAANSPRARQQASLLPQLFTGALLH
jgi:hypothetical protein